MAKICIIEDSESDLVSRYSFLTATDHEVHVVLDWTPRDNWDDGLALRMKKRRARRLAEENGFDQSRIHQSSLSSKDMIRALDFPESDVYFCDGLQWLFFDVADKIGKDRTYLYSYDMGIKKRAEREGYRVLNGSLREAIKEFSHEED